MQVRKQQLEPDMDQQTGCISVKEYVRAVYCHPAYLIGMQGTSCEMLDCMNHNDLWFTVFTLFKRWEYQTTLPASWEICMQVKKHQLELDMEQQTGSQLGKEYVKAVYFHPAYLTYMQST